LGGGRRAAAIGLFALVAGGIGVGAWTGFPVFSDALVPLLVHDTGAASLAARHADRPLYGGMLHASVAAFGIRRLPWIALGFAAWALLAWAASRLHRLVLPESAEWSWLPALLVISPIVVQTQYVTLTIAYPGVLPVALVLWGLSAGAGAGLGRAGAALVLAALAASISEYGVAAAFAGAVLAMGLGRRRGALGLAAGAACGFLVFRLTADASARPDVTADALLPTLAAAPVAGLYRWLSGIWHATVGAWGGAAWHTQLDPRSRASLAIAALGAVGSVLAVVAAPRPADAGSAREAEPPPPAARRLLFLLLAVAAAILPVAAAGRATVFSAAWTGDYETRFLLPALPFASVLVSGAIARGMTRRAASAAAALLAFLCVEASWEGARQAMRSERWAEQLGRALLPVVRSSDGLVVAVGEDDPRLKWGSTLTGKLTRSWRDEDARRVWAMARSTAGRVVGARAGCRVPGTIDFDAEIRGLRRSGRLSSLMWVTPAGDRVAPLEPYCVPPPTQ
jgi:hypothetical protein